MAPIVLLEYTKAKKVSQDLSFTMMGKKHKLAAKGYPSGFVPDYRHAVETMGESEGFGSYSCADSEDSCTPKRKCINLNVDLSDVLNIPLQVISLFKLSTSEKKALNRRLRVELEQVQVLKKRILSMGADGGAVLSSSTSGNWHRHTTTPQTTPQVKRGVSGRFESAKRAPRVSAVSNTNVMLKQCDTLLKRLMSNKFSWVFNEPVDVVKLGIPDYFTVIKQPMDFGTIKKKLSSGAYSSPWGFASDVRLTFTNALTYNPPGNDVHVMADTMSKFFEVRWKPIEKNLSTSDLVSPTISTVVPQEDAKPMPPSKKRKVPPTVTPIVPLPLPVSEEDVKQKMMDEEKQAIGRELESLFGELPENIIEFLRRHSDNANQTSEEEIEIDIDALSDDTLIELRKLLDDYLEDKRLRNQVKAEQCAVEVLNESGISSFYMQPLKANEPMEEDVDIGGNDPPVSSYPPVEIDKDTAGNSSSSSSGSDSSSLSSDTDSASSFESESDICKDSAPMNVDKKEAVKFDIVDPEKSDVVNPVDANNQPEHNVHSKAASFAKGLSQEGEKSPSERQVSPEKRIRMALLKNRFADTILKAREKTFDKAEKGDPEKLRLEKEELERQKREDKARIQAEAKAAEEASRQAQAAAAAEAKQKREIEREAARQALLKMENSVEIDESSQFLKDLEMLRTAPTEQLPSSVDETSPDHSREGIGGFKLGGSNPLEQLGLFMKEDDEEEEEVERSCMPVNDIEEGEIDR